jgi:uncharacterized membrane protein YbaN (DUF454 family)
MKIKEIFRIVFGTIVLIIGSIGWLIPIPLVPFFLLFFVGLHMLHLDLKLVRLLKKLGLKTDTVEKYLEKTAPKNKK